MNTSVIFTSILENDNPALEGRHYPASQTIPATDFIWEVGPDGKEREVAIRYVSGEKSIYIDEQFTDKKVVPEPFVLGPSGSMSVSQREILKLSYLLKSNYNEGNKNRMPNKSAIYRVWNEEKEAEKAIESYKEDKELRDKILMLDADEIDALAIILGDIKAPEKKFNIKLHDLILQAENNPQLIREAMSSVDNQRKADILKAISKKIIAYDSKTNEITWTSGGVIAKVPIGKDYLNYLCSISFLPEYQSFTNELNVLLLPDKEREKILNEKKYEEELKQIFTAAIEKGIFIVDEFWYTLIGHEKGGIYHEKGGIYKNFCKGKKASFQFFKNDENLQAIVKEMLIKKNND